MCLSSGCGRQNGKRPKIWRGFAVPSCAGLCPRTRAREKIPVKPVESFLLKNGKKIAERKGLGDGFIKKKKSGEYGKETPDFIFYKSG